MNYFEIETIKTAKPFGNKGNYQVFDGGTKKFKTLEEVKEYLRDEYGNCKRDKQYIDNENNGAVHTGYVYCFKNSDISHDSEGWYQQDWVTIYNIEAKHTLL